MLLLRDGVANELRRKAPSSRNTLIYKGIVEVAISGLEGDL
jgi:hypothetical protein